MQINEEFQRRETLNNYNSVTYAQIQLMQHAIGFSKNQVKGTKHRIMHAYRNYFCDSICDEWEALKVMGLADRSQENKDGYVYYRVTKDGLQFLADLCGFNKIMETD